MRALHWKQMVDQFVEVKNKLNLPPFDIDSKDTPDIFFSLMNVFLHLAKFKNLLGVERLESYPVTVEIFNKIETEYFKDTVFAIQDYSQLSLEEKESKAEEIKAGFDDVLEYVTSHMDKSEEPSSFRILHWAIEAQRHMIHSRTPDLLVSDGHWEISLAGIDLASIYKRNLVGKLEGYPETVRGMCQYWDKVGLTGLSGLTECSDHPMSEEQCIEALERITKHLDYFELIMKGEAK